MKYALITGGARGIGKAISEQLAKDGFYVLINFVSNIDAAKATLEKIKFEGGNGELLQFDVSNPKQVETVLDNWAEKNEDKVIEVLINNAGSIKDNLMVFMSDDEWKSVISANQDSFFYVTRGLLKKMIVNRYGRIINIVSLSGLKGMAGQVNYSAAKGAVIAATRSLAMEIGKKKVTVNAVAPGFIKTDMTDNINEKEMKKFIPLNRFGKVEEVADLVSFLASEKSSYITGETISINGGLYS